jgi:predicted nucleotidyltransferase
LSQPETLDLTSEQYEILRTLLQRHLPDATVLAYGSRVSGKARRYSDLDVVVLAPPSVNTRLNAFKEALDESNLPFLVDVHLWDELPPSFREQIKNRYVVVQEPDDGNGP